MQFAQHNLLLELIVLIIIWNQIYIISLEPVKSWDSKFHTTIYPLTGINVQIVPSDEKGYRIDSASVGSLKGNVSSNTSFVSLKVDKGDIFEASLYCYVSEDFNGDSVKILVNGAVNGTSESFYRIVDSKNDNQNQNRNLISNGNFESGTTNWSIGADSTTHTIIETPFGKGIRVSRGDGNGMDWSLRYNGRPIIHYAGHTYQIKFIFKVQKGIGIPFSIGWWVDLPNHGYALPLEIKDLKNGWKEATCSYKFKETSNNLSTFLNAMHNNSVIDIANVEMIDLDRNDSIPFFFDQLNKKGTWQKLKIDVPCFRRKVSFCLSISKKGVKNLKSLRGYVIFAKPEYRVMKKK